MDIDGRWQLAAYCRTRGEDQLFRLDRIWSASLSDEHFEPPARFDASGFLELPDLRSDPGAAPASVTFGLESARWARERFRDNLVEVLPDGRVVCEFHAGAATQLADIAAEFEGDVEIEGPEGLRRDYIERIEAIEKLYS